LRACLVGGGCELAQESSKSSYQIFDEGRFSEEEIAVIKRLLPSSMVSFARNSNRKEFFKHALSRLKNSSRIISSIRRTFYKMSMGLSKRVESETEEKVPSKPLSIRQPS
jgi:hypothetical protein